MEKVLQEHGWDLVGNIIAHRLGNIIITGSFRDRNMILAQLLPAAVDLGYIIIKEYWSDTEYCQSDIGNLTGNRLLIDTQDHLVKVKDISKALTRSRGNIVSIPRNYLSQLNKRSGDVIIYVSNGGVKISLMD